MPPRVSVITPSFNQARFLVDTLASVRAQGDVVLEHLVIDGGSTDGTRELLERSEGVWWVSERDRGQSDALRKGLARARGDIIGWVNSDDAYADGALDRAVAELDADPGLAMVYGHSAKIDEHGAVIGRVDAVPLDLEGLLSFGTIPQPSCFVRRSAIDAAGGLDASLRYAMDYDLWLRIALAGGRWRAFDEVWAKFRLHGASKTVAETSRFLPEVEQAMERALASPRLPAELVPRRAAIRRAFHTAWARASYASIDLPTTRASLARALASDPRGVDRTWLSLAVKSSLSTRGVVMARELTGWVRSLRGRA